MSIQKKNMAVVEQLTMLSDLESYGGNVWPSKAYKSAADTILGLDIPIDTVGDLKSLSGIGESIADKIMEILKTGTCKKLDALKKRYASVVESRVLLKVPGIGVKTAVKLYDQGITSLEELSNACDDGRISAKSIKSGIKLALNTQGRIPLTDVMPVVSPLLDEIRGLLSVERASFVGSIRRGRETIKDVDILVVSNNKSEVINKFLEYGQELVRGEQKVRIIIPINQMTSVQVDLLFTSLDEWGTAQIYFTGSKEHNIAIRRRAIDMGYSLNEHGLTTSSGSLITFSTEEELYSYLKMPWCPPELREGSDILESVPKLIESKDIVSDWHMHTTWSRDARSTFVEMAEQAKSIGYNAIGVTDHTEIQYGWDPNKIDERRLEAEMAAEKVGIKIYVGCETGINPDGTLDWSDEYLSKMDYVIASIHRQHSTNTVERLIKAARHPMVRIIGHPTGRMINRREIPDEDWGSLFKVCAEENVLLEINGPRMDLDVSLIRQAKSFGCKFIINSDAHHTSQLSWMQYGVLNARRAGLTADDICFSMA